MAELRAEAGHARSVGKPDACSTGASAKPWLLATGAGDTGWTLAELHTSFSVELCSNDPWWIRVS